MCFRVKEFFDYLQYRKRLSSRTQSDVFEFLKEKETQFLFAEDNESVRRFCANLAQRLSQKWKSSSRNLKTFQEKNNSWLTDIECVPDAQCASQRTPPIPRPSIPFDELSRRSQLRATQDERSGARFCDACLRSKFINARRGSSSPSTILESSGITKSRP